MFATNIRPHRHSAQFICLSPLNLISETRRRRKESVGLQILVGAAFLPREVAPVPRDPHLWPRVWPGPGVSSPPVISQSVSPTPCPRLTRGIVPPALLCHKEPAQGIQSPQRGAFLVYRCFMAYALSRGNFIPKPNTAPSLLSLKISHFSFCEAPASVAPYVWPDDITKWPICRKRKEHADTPPSEAEHMVCEVIGHPCCIGIRGQCQITTKEFCDFVKGVFHEEAALCSQVNGRIKIDQYKSLANIKRRKKKQILW